MFTDEYIYIFVFIDIRCLSLGEKKLHHAIDFMTRRDKI